MRQLNIRGRRTGFTIIELIVVITIIAILAAIVIFSLGAWQRSVRSSQVKNELNAASQAMENVRNFTNNYPASIPGTYQVTPNVTVTLPLTTTTEYCLDGVSASDNSVKFYLYSKQLKKGPLQGTCAADKPNLDPPATPVGVGISGNTQISMTLGWSSVTGASSYIAQCATDPVFIVSKKQVTVDSPLTFYIFTGLTTNTQYYCRVKAVNNVGASGWSSTVNSKSGTPTGTPVVGASTNSVASALFSWPAVSGAVSYSLQYNIDGGPWVDGFTQVNQLNFTVSGYHNRRVNVRVLAHSSEGVASSYGTASVVTPLWGTFTYQNGWSDYGAPYATGGFTRTSTGAVILRGLLKRTGSVVSGETIAQLPSATYYPYTYSGGAAKEYTFMVAITGNGPSASMRLTSDGRITAATDVSATATSLDNVVYMPSTGLLGDSFTSLTPIHGWTNRSSPSLEPSLGYKIDSLGRVFIEGTLNPGTITADTDIATLPTSSPDISVSPKLIIAMRAGCNGYTGINVYDTLATRGNCLGSALFTQTMYYPNAAGASWTTMTLQNSWVVFNASNNATPQYTKAADGVVTLKGLIKSGTTSSGVVLTTLPEGYRPSATLVFPSICADAPCRIDIEPDGQVRGRGVDSGWSSLSGINFVAEQ